MKNVSKKEGRTETISIVVTPGVKTLLQRMAAEEERTISFVTHKFLMESPSLRRLLSKQSGVER